MQIGARVFLLSALFLSAGCLGQRLQVRELEPVENVVAKLPSCAVPCLATAVLNSTCSLADAQCICSNKKIEADAGKCILASCSLPDALATKNVTLTGCNAPVRDSSGSYRVMALTVGIITTVITVARLIFKRFFSTTQTFTVDDLVITIALILHISCTTINVAGLATHGLGRDIWTLAPEELRTFTFYLYIIEIHFFTEISLAKISLLLFYLNIFPEKRIRRLLWGTAILIAVFGLVSSVIAIFQCTPVDYFWTQYSGTSAGHCLNINAFAWSNASVHVATDIWMLGIPLSQIPKLKLHWKKKLAAAFMFMTGLFITVAATLRMQSLVHFANSDNPTWDQTIVCVWATIETNVSIICTCLPTMRLIVLRIFPKVFGSGTKRSKSYVTYESAQSNSSGKKSTGGYPVSETKSAAGMTSSVTDSSSV